MMINPQDANFLQALEYILKGLHCRACDGFGCSHDSDVKEALQDVKDMMQQNGWHVIEVLPPTNYELIMKLLGNPYHEQDADENQNE